MKKMEREEKRNVNMNTFIFRTPYDIMSAIYEDVMFYKKRCNITSLVRKINMSNGIINNYVVMLEERGFIKRELYKNAKYIEFTDYGLTVMNMLKELNKFIESHNIIESHK